MPRNLRSSPAPSWPLRTPVSATKRARSVSTDNRMGNLSSKRVHTSSDHAQSQYPTPASTQASSPTVPSFLNPNKAEVSSKFDALNEAQFSRQASYGKDPVATHPFAAVNTAASRKRDRYTDVYPWAKNRVKLNVRDGWSDYINASLVSTAMPWLDERLARKYIVTQGPRPVDISCFWTMMWDAIPTPELPSRAIETSRTDQKRLPHDEKYNQSTIIMVTKTHEGLTEKCAPYWEDEDGKDKRSVVPRQIGSRLNTIAIKVDSHIPQAESMFSQELPSTETLHSQAIGCDVRKISMVQLPKSPTQHGTTAPNSGTFEQPTTKHTTHYNFTAWPDYGCPSGDSKEQLLKLISETRQKPEPVVVHCSAGVGRSGTFIAIEALLSALETGSLLQKWHERTGGMQSRGRSLTPDSPSTSRRKAATVPLPTSSLRPTRNVSKSTMGGQIFSSPIAMNGIGDALPMANPSPPLDSSTSPSPVSEHVPLTQDQGAKQWDPVVEIVNRLREQRMTMVQSEAQLAFIYQILREKWEERYCGGDEAKARYDADLEGPRDGGSAMKR